MEGRDSYYETYPDIDHKFLDVLENYTAGNPMRDDILWTNLTLREIANLLSEKHNIHVSSMVIRRLLRKHKYSRRKAQKKQTMKAVNVVPPTNGRTEDKEAQFDNIAQLKSEYQATGNPIISIDTKKKEFIGNYYRPGHLYTQQEIHTYDHDFNSFAEGVVIPHGIYDIKQNSGYINIGISSDTSEFVCDSIRNWWYGEGQKTMVMQRQY